MFIYEPKFMADSVVDYPSLIYFLLISSNIPKINFVAHIYATNENHESHGLGLFL